MKNIVIALIFLQILGLNLSLSAQDVAIAKDAETAPAATVENASKGDTLIKETKDKKGGIFAIFNKPPKNKFRFVSSFNTQYDTVNPPEFKINFDAYIDMHYCWDFDRPYDKTRLYGSNPIAVNQFGLAYMYGQVSMSYKKIHLNIAIHAGDIVELMYLAEPGFLKPIREASISYEINDKFRVEYGIMPSIYGYETFINRDNLFATRAVMTDFAPDFDHGLRFHYKFGKRFSGNIQVTNGWQVIRDNNGLPGFGMVNKYHIDNVFLLNWGLYGGQEPYQGQLDLWRMYSNLFAQIKIKKLTAVLLFDLGFQQDSTRSNFNTWHSYSVMLHYKLPKGFAIAARYERMYDPRAIVAEIITNTPNNYQMHGGTLTLEYHPNPIVMLRLENRFTYNLDPIFTTEVENQLQQTDFFIMLSAIVKLSYGNAPPAKH